MSNTLFNTLCLPSTVCPQLTEEAWIKTGKGAEGQLPSHGLESIYFQRAFCNYILKELDAAARDFNQVLVLSPRDWKARYFKAFILFQHNQDFNGALKDLNFIIGMGHQNNADVICFRGLVCYANGDEKQATQVLDQVCTLCPQLFALN